jgi:hypothetical protein
VGQPHLQQHLQGEYRLKSMLASQLLIAPILQIFKDLALMRHQMSSLHVIALVQASTFWLLLKF